MSLLRELARAAMKVGAWRFIRAVSQGEIVEGEKWVLGKRRKTVEDARRQGVDVGDVEEGEPGLDETLARCWLVVHAVAVGWGQRDLVEELNALFT